jgi:excisionase family DNA binding protein
VDESPKYLNTRQIAAEYGFDLDTVQSWCDSGKLRAFKIGREWRIHRDDWARFVRPNKPPAPSEPRRAVKKSPGRSRVRAQDDILDRAGV